MYWSGDDELIKMNGIDILLLPVIGHLKPIYSCLEVLQEYLEFLLQICFENNQNLFLKILCQLWVEF